MARRTRSYRLITWLHGRQHQALRFDGQWRLYPRGSVLPLKITWWSYAELRAWIHHQHAEHSRRKS